IGPKTMPRKFDSGATRDDETGKYDYAGALDPNVLDAFTAYMHSHRFLSDGTIRSAGNWKKGIPLDSYLASFARHFFDLWRLHEGTNVVRPETGEPITTEEALGGLLFNLQGYWRSYLLNRDNSQINTPTV